MAEELESRLVVDFAAPLELDVADDAHEVVAVFVEDCDGFLVVLRVEDFGTGAHLDDFVDFVFLHFGD